MRMSPAVRTSHGARVQDSPVFRQAYSVLPPAAEPIEPAATSVMTALPMAWSFTLMKTVGAVLVTKIMLPMYALITGEVTIAMEPAVTARFTASPVLAVDATSYIMEKVIDARSGDVSAVVTVNVALVRSSDR